MSTAPGASYLPGDLVQNNGAQLNPLMSGLERVDNPFFGPGSMRPFVRYASPREPMLVVSVVHVPDCVLKTGRLSSDWWLLVLTATGAHWANEATCARVNLHI